MADPVVSVPWRAQEGPQLESIKKHWVSELFYGGAVGGGKTAMLLMDFAQDIPNYGANWKGIMFRRSYPQLEELIAQSKQMYPGWFPGAEWTQGNHTWTFRNGAELKFRHAEDEDSWTMYQGHAFTWQGYDEYPQWPTPNFYRQMKTRLRSAAAIPNKRIRATGNPGNVGHGHVKQYFKIAEYPLGGHLIPADKEGGQRMFVKSSVYDNRILLENDPEYIQRLEGLGSPELVRMYLQGDWNVVAGCFFTEFSVSKHVIRGFPIPRGWVRYRAMDWGSSRPFCVLWFAVSDGSIAHIPRGALVCYREWYGMKAGEPNIGLKLTAEEVARGILEREAESEKIDMSVADPSIYKVDGGPSIGSRMSNLKCYFQPADNSRKTGWDMVRSRLKGGDEGPMLFFFENCPETIRTLPALQHDRGKAAGSIEDVDSDGEDHAGDTVRYACMARPWIRPGQPAEAPERKYDNRKVITTSTTFNDLVQAARKRRREANTGSIFGG